MFCFSVQKMKPEEHIKKIRDELNEMARDGHFKEFTPSTLHGAIEEYLLEMLQSFQSQP